MLSTIRDALKPGTKSVSGDAVNAALEQARSELEAAKRTLAELDDARRAVLLEGDDASVDRHDQAERDARRTLERLRVAVPALEARVAELRSEEADRALSARIEEAKTRQKEGVKKIERYGELAGEMVGLLADMKKTDTFIDEVRNDARKAGRGDEAPVNANEVARPCSADTPLHSDRKPYEPSFTSGRPHHGGVRLPSASGHGLPLWGDGPKVPSETPTEERKRAEEDRRERKERARNQPPPRPAGNYNGDGTPADRWTRLEYDKWQQEIAAGSR